MLESLIKLFNYYKGLGEKTFNQLDEEELFIEPSEGINSISIIVKHLHGNMLSRWTNFLNEDGEKEHRDRDEEFRSTIKSRDEMMQKWNEGWDCCFDTLQGSTKNDLEKVIYIRNEGHTVIEAIHRQLAHYAYHIGQIIYLGKIIKGEKWESLSIPRDKSDEYNQQKFAEEVGQRHFTGDV